MPSQPAPGDPLPYSARQRGTHAVLAYSPAEWKLLVRLPGRVIIAATSTDPGNPRRTVVEGLAGLEAMAAGRFFDSDLVRAVAAAVYAESVADDGPYASGYTERDAGLASVLRSCREAVTVLARRADPADSAAYRQWVQSIAARVCAASRSAGLPTPAAEQLGPAERHFLEDLGHALGMP